MLSFLVFVPPKPRISLSAFRIPPSPASFTLLTSSTSSTSQLSARAQQAPQHLLSHPNPAPTRHTRHAGSPATPSFSYASAHFPSHRGCASGASPKIPLFASAALLTPLDTTLTNPPATVGSKQLPGTLNRVDATLTKNPEGRGHLLLSRFPMRKSVLTSVARKDLSSLPMTEASGRAGKRVCPEEHRDEGSLLGSLKDLYPERPAGVRDLSAFPMRKSVLTSVARKDLSSHATPEASGPVGKRVCPARPSASSTHTPFNAACASNLGVS
jgi:hypothetical protein